MDATLEHDNLAVEEQLDISQEEHELKNLNDLFIDLQNIYSEIEQAAGINKTIAVAIESVKPGLLSPYTPINSFTIETSKTNLTTSMEDVIGGIVGTIKFIYKTTAMIIGKIIEFIKRLFTRIKQKDAKNQEVVANAKALSVEIYNLKTRFAPADHKVYDIVFKEIAADANEELRALHNDLFKEIFSGNHVRAIMAAIGPEFNKYVGEINSKYVILDKVVSAGEKIDLSSAIHDLSIVDKYIKNGGSENIINKSLNGRGNGTIASDLCLVKDYVYHLAENKTTNQLNYQNVFDMLKADTIVLTDIFILDLSYSEKNLQTLKSKVEKLESKVDKMSSNFTVQSHLKDSAKVVKEEIVGLLEYILTCNKVTSVNTEISNFIYTYVNRHYKRLLAEARKSEDVVTQNAAKESYFKNKS